ncbi:MAG: hypothetical protein PVH24_08495 [Candidatus Zixiibacteriota bacterium]|jgi:hypothetical protein
MVKSRYYLLFITVVLTALIVTAGGCSKVFEKTYQMEDETAPVVTLDGYRVVLELNSRLAGYSVNEDLFYLDFDVSYNGTWNDSLGKSPVDYVSFDSVCVRLFKSDSTVCLHKINEYEVRDNYYNRDDYLTKIEYSAVELSSGNAYVTISYRINITDPQSGEITKTERFEQELRRFAHRTY